MKKYTILSLFLLLFSTLGESAETSRTVDSQQKYTQKKTTSLAQYAQPREQASQTEAPSYPLFRQHDLKYYPEKNTRTAILLSATLPGLGQAYAGDTTKGLVFLVAELGLLSVAGFNLDRALHYDDMADRFTTGFQDPHSDAFLTPEQGRVKSRSHITLGAVFLAAGVGVHIWNILDATDTVERYNKRRFTAQMQQTGTGETYLSFTRRF